MPGGLPVTSDHYPGGGYLVGNLGQLKGLVQMDLHPKKCFCQVSSVNVDSLAQVAVLRKPSLRAPMVADSGV